MGKAIHEPVLDAGEESEDTRLASVMVGRFRRRIFRHLGVSGLDVR
jgi:hypothetical protein